MDKCSFSLFCLAGGHFLRPIVRAACFIRAKGIRLVNWYGSLGTVSKDGVVPNARGFFVPTARPLASLWMKRLPEATKRMRHVVKESTYFTRVSE